MWWLLWLKQESMIPGGHHRSLTLCVHVCAHAHVCISACVFVLVHVFEAVHIPKWQGRGRWRLNEMIRKNLLCKGIKDSTKLRNYGLPWWRSGWESACQCSGHGFEPWSGRIPHAAERLGPWATATEPARLEPVLRNKRGRDSERSAHRDEEWPPLAAN